MLSWCPLLVAAFQELLLNGEAHSGVIMCVFLHFFLHFRFFFLCLSQFPLNEKCMFFFFFHRVPLPGMETHIPVIFLNLKRM